MMESEQILELAETIRQKDEELLRRNESIELLTRENVALKELLAASDQHLVERETERGSLLADQETLRVARQELHDTKQRIGDLEARREELVGSLAKLERQNNELRSAKIQQEGLGERIPVLESQAEELRAANRELEASLRETERQKAIISSERDQFSNRLTRALGEATTLKDELAVAREKVFSIESVERSTERDRLKLGKKGSL